MFEAESKQGRSSRSVFRLSRVVAVAGAALIAGALYASNMGYKIVYPLKAADGGVTSASGTQTVCLPYFRKVGLENAGDLRQLINDQAGTSAVLGITKFIRSSDGAVTYAGINEINNFSLEAGVGYTVQVNTDVDFQIMGSHDPDADVSLLSSADPGSASGQNHFCGPYHTTAASASELLNEIDGLAGAGAVLGITKFIKSSDGAVTYAGTLILNDFALEMGASYTIQVSTNVSYIPSHY